MSVIGLEYPASAAAPKVSINRRCTRHSGLSACAVSAKPTSWSIYKMAAVRLGAVEAPGEATAIEEAAAEFKGAGHEADGDTAMTKAMSPAVTSSTNGHIIWRSRPRRCGV